MIIDKNIEVKAETIYSSANLVTHCLLQSILTRWRWSNVMMIRSDKDEKSKSLYSTVKYNLTWLREKLLTLSLSKMKSKTSLNAIVEMMNHHLCSMMHQQLKMMQDWVYDAIMLFFEAVFAFASTLNENTTYVNRRCAQIMNAVIASDHLIITIYHVSAIIKSCRDKYAYQELWIQSLMQKMQKKQKKQTWQTWQRQRCKRSNEKYTFQWKEQTSRAD